MQEMWWKNLLIGTNSKSNIKVFVTTFNPNSDKKKGKKQNKNKKKDGLHTEQGGEERRTFQPA